MKCAMTLQGYGQTRNIVSFTGRDLFCRPEFYAKTFELIKRGLQIRRYISRLMAGIDA